MKVEHINRRAAYVGLQSGHRALMMTVILFPICCIMRFVERTIPT